MEDPKNIAFAGLTILLTLYVVRWYRNPVSTRTISSAIVTDNHFSVAERDPHPRRLLAPRAVLFRCVQLHAQCETDIE